MQPEIRLFKPSVGDEELGAVRGDSSAVVRRMGFADANFRNPPYIRLTALDAHIAAGRLTSNLRWSALTSEEI
jgi:hypothetical protein